MNLPQTPESLMREQRRLAEVSPEPYGFDVDDAVGGCFVCFARGGVGTGRADDEGWAASAVIRGRATVARAVTPGQAGGPYIPGLLALREGPLLEAALRSLPRLPDVLLVNATGRDHPRGAGMALQLGAVLDLPTVGVTDRVLVAAGDPPGPERGAMAPLYTDELLVGYRLRTRSGARPVAVTSAWRTDAATAVRIVMSATRRVRTPEPIRVARRLAREARTAAGKAQAGPEDGK